MGKGEMSTDLKDMMKKQQELMQTTKYGEKKATAKVREMLGQPAIAPEPEKTAPAPEPEKKTSP